MDVVVPLARPGAEAPEGKVEVRTIEKQQIFVNGKPVGPLFD
jgi:hypothetical protein